MAGGAQKDASYGLTLPVSGQNQNLDSPGSSVFDLPTQGVPDSNTPGNATSPGRHPSPRLELGRIAGSHDAQNPSPSFVVISGGTGGNAICSAFTNASYVLPVSDDGGSSSEIIRVLGGPSIGDIRSRLIRLIPYAAPNSPLDAIRRLLAYRLPARCSEREAREEWREIVEGRNPLWIGIPNDRKETIRGFLVYFESELLKRAHKNFDFRNGSIGNYFLAAAQGFFRSLPSAIFLFSSITNSQANILPVIVTNHTVTIAAELENGSRLVGQCEISHPVAQNPAPVDITISESDPYSPVDGMGECIAPPQNMMFEAASKAEYEALGSWISRLFYINAYGIEIHPSPNQEYLAALASKDVGTSVRLNDSIIPCLALRGVAAGIARSCSLRAKVLLCAPLVTLSYLNSKGRAVNSSNDRETDGYTAADYIQAMARTLNGSYHTQPYGLGYVNTTYPISAFVTHLVYLRGTKILVDEEHITSLGVKCTEIGGHANSFDAEVVRQAINEIELG
ncbi:hypothetical protein D9615_006412 [Tricholomella constricta]|uniref:Uncharacterized protein n=1 Tax=Tricholomella constricta TaxID=117010 RepID=A0A8H5H5U0_9AGAR|nr:hypothetical protein D9615_006412 [Tricholomella constricta]